MVFDLEVAHTLYDLQYQTYIIVNLDFDDLAVKHSLQLPNMLTPLCYIFAGTC